MKTSLKMSLSLALFPLALGTGLLLRSQVLHADAKGQMEDFRSWKNRPQDPFNDAEKSFQKAKQELLAHYVDDKITEKQLYQFAVEGMLAGLNQDQREWNRLYSPAEFKELQADMAGKIVGAGVEIKFDPESGITDVLSVIPGTPAEKAGITAGDKILKIRGKSYKGMDLRDVVYDIRGQAGESVPLTLLHGDKVVTRTIHRETIPWSTVETARLPDNILMISIREFTQTTPSLLKTALAELSHHPARGLVLDLRQNAGGLFDKMLESLALMVPDGTPVVTAIQRGGSQEKIVTHGTPILAPLSIAVLINRDTACGAEIMARVLKLTLGAVLVGTHTFGKWSSQTVNELANHFAMKYTVAIFQGPQGENFDGVGMDPDINVDLGTGKVLESIRRSPDLKKRISEDEPLHAAMGIVKLKHG